MSSAIVVGNPKPASRTFLAARSLVEKLTGAPPDVEIDVITFGAGLLDWNDPQVARAVADVTASRLVVFASPTFKAAYTGVLKLFLDRFAAGSLAAVTAIPLQLGGSWQHALAPEVFLKPVLSELGASTPTRGLYLLDSAWQESEALTAWLEVARVQLREVLQQAG